VITLIGLGAGDADTLSRGAERALRTASDLHAGGRGKLFLRTARHPVVETLREWGLHFETFDALYESASDFSTLYASIATHIFTEAQPNPAADAMLPIAYAVPGHPLIAEESVRQIRERAATAGIPTHIVSSGSFVEASLAAAGAALGVDSGVDVRDALTLTPTDTVDRQGAGVTGRVDVSRGLLLYHVHDGASASHAKLSLMRDYPDDWEVILVRHAGVAGQEEARRIPLFRLDREPVDHLTSVYIPPLPPPLRRPAFAELVGIMARLRAPDGCPWDREQTHSTLKKYFIEETYEVIEAIDADNPDQLCEELGDALLQVVFHAQLASEEGIFTIDDVTARIVEKLVRRHPHVFGELDVTDSDEVLRNWERIKREEKAGRETPWRESVLDGVPKGLPALMQAMEISKRAVKVGFDWGAFEDVQAKLDEELAELRAELAVAVPNRDAIFHELGDLLFTVVQIARWQKLDPEDALRAMLTRFSTRFRHVERRARECGRDLTELSLAEMDAYWEEAKAQSRETPGPAHLN